jgi:phosphoribosylamine---glycine ligase
VNVLIVGSGGREHALAWKLSQSPELTSLHAAPGNPGIAELGECHPVRAEDGEGLLDLCRSLSIDLAVVGPEAPLVAGVGDELRRGGVAVFGPSAAAARIEGSKTFAKDVMRTAGVATAASMPVARPPCVVKADGLAAGKGVFLCHDRDSLETALRAVSALGDSFVVEELLEGEELSIFALCDGTSAVALPSAQDYKRAYDGDGGPNTGGMGAYSPVPGFDREQVEALMTEIHQPVLAELAARGTPFIGALFAGLMLTDDGPRVLEFNCRFGDPETQSILPQLEGDLLAALAAAAAGDLEGVELTAGDTAAVTVVLAAGDYPGGGDTGTAVEGISDVAELGALVFHAGTALRDDRLVTNGGRILNVTGVAGELARARELAYAGAERISFAGVRYRHDIAGAVAARENGVRS